MNQKRQPKGITIGGQFAQSKNQESHIDLGDGSYSETDERGNTFHYNSAGHYHRDGGLPAIEFADGSKSYYANGQRHRDGGLPAIEWSDGTKEYYINGHLHRDGGLPAIERADGEKWYCVNGRLHRNGGLPAIERSDGYKAYYVNGQRHNVCGPAVVDPTDGTIVYFIDGEPLSEEEWRRHPAVVGAQIRPAFEEWDYYRAGDIKQMLANLPDDEPVVGLVFTRVDANDLSPSSGALTDEQWAQVARLTAQRSDVSLGQLAYDLDSAVAEVVDPESNLVLGDGSSSETDERGNTRHYNPDGQLHRDGGLPAIEWSDGLKWYWVNGKPHRDGGLPAIEYADGTKEYWVNNQRHRDGGLPAYEEADGYEAYLVHDQLHNINGPATVTARGYCEYWLRGHRVSEAEWNKDPEVIEAKKQREEQA